MGLEEIQTNYLCREFSFLSVAFDIYNLIRLPIYLQEYIRVATENQLFTNSSFFFFLVLTLPCSTSVLFCSRPKKEVLMIVRWGRKRGMACIRAAHLSPSDAPKTHTLSSLSVAIQSYENRICGRSMPDKKLICLTPLMTS